MFIKNRLACREVQKITEKKQQRGNVEEKISMNIAKRMPRYHSIFVSVTINGAARLNTFFHFFFGWNFSPRHFLTLAQNRFARVKIEN